MNHVIARLRGGRLARDTDLCRAGQGLRNRPGRTPALAAEDCCRAVPAAGARLLTAAGTVAAGRQRTTGTASAGGQPRWTSKSILIPADAIGPRPAPAARASPDT
jgi:hypothetical protein